MLSADPMQGADTLATNDQMKSPTPAAPSPGESQNLSRSNAKSESPDVLEAALGLASLGLRVLALKPRSKYPRMLG